MYKDQINIDFPLFVLQPKPPNPDWRYSASLRAGMQGYVLHPHLKGLCLIASGKEAVVLRPDGYKLHEKFSCTCSTDMKWKLYKAWLCSWCLWRRTSWGTVPINSDRSIPILLFGHCINQLFSSRIWIDFYTMLVCLVLCASRLHAHFAYAFMSNDCLLTVTELLYSIEAHHDRQQQSFLKLLYACTWF